MYTHIIGMLCFQLANLEPAFKSKLESINLVSIFRWNLLEHYSVDAILEPFIQDLKIGKCMMNSDVCSHTCYIPLGYDYFCEE